MEEPGSDMHAIVTKMIRDMKIVGWYFVISGAIYCLSIFGAILGIPYIIAGLRLKDAAAEYGGWLNHDQGALFRALQLQQKHYFILMVVLVASIVLAAVMMIVMFSVFAVNFSDFMQVAV